MVIAAIGTVENYTRSSDMDQLKRIDISVISSRKHKL